MANLFISHSSVDQDLAERAKVELEAVGFLALFLDTDPKRGIAAGQNWERELYIALRRSDAVVFLATDSSVGSRWCFAELAVARSLGKPVFPVRASGFARPDLLSDLQEVRLATDKSGFGELISALRRAGFDPDDSFDWDASRSPYPGLTAFAPEDAAVFFGRDVEVGRLLQFLHPTLVGGSGRWVGIIGPSGSGKSSLVRAGLLPRLMRHPEQWLLLPPMVPGTRPTRGLASCLSRSFSEYGRQISPSLLESELRDPVTGPERLMTRIFELQEAAHGQPNVLVVIDQAEELITRSGAHEMQLLLHLLSTVLRDDSPMWVVSTVRSEFLGVSPDRAGLAEVIDDHLVVEPLSRTRLPEVIARPAQRAGLEFEAGLCERMVEETTGGDALPLLAYTLSELAAQVGDDGVMSHALYERLGGVVGGVQRRADRLFDDLRRRGHGARVLPTLLRLASVDDEGLVVGRRLPRAALDAEEQTVVDAFVEARLLTTSPRHNVAETTHEHLRADVGVAHEALLRQWSPLGELIDEARSDLRTRAAMDREALDWEHGGRDSSYLARGSQLAAFEDWARRNAGEIDGLGEEFLTASRRLTTEQLAAVQRSNRRLRGSLVGLAAFLVLTLVAMVIATRQSVRADAQADLALSRQLLAQADLVYDRQPDLSLLLRLQAMQVATDSGKEDARTALLDGLNRSFHVSSPLLGHASAVNRILFSPDGSTVVSGDESGTVRLWNAADRTAVGIPLVSAAGAVHDMAYDGDGHLLAVATGSRVEMWEVRAGTRHGPDLTGHGQMVSRTVFSPDGSLLASASLDGTVRIWDVRAGALHGRPLIGHRAAVFDLAFSPDGRTLASASFDSTLRLWDVATGALRTELVGHRARVTSVAFSPDGATLLSASADSTARLWEVATGGARAQLVGHTGGLSVAAFSPDGSTVATAGADDTVRRWDGRSGEPLGAPLTGHTGDVLDVVFSSDRRTIASVSNDGTGRLWDAATGVALGEPLAAHTGWLNDVAFSPDGRTVATAGEDTTGRLWQVSSTEPPLRRGLGGEAGWVTSIAFGPGNTLVTATNQGAVQVWDTDRGAVRMDLARFSGSMNSVAVSEGGLVAAGGDDHIVRLWQLPSGEPVGSALRADDAVTDVAVGPDGLTVAAAVADGSVLIWDTVEGQLRARLTGHTGRVNAVSFAPTGMLASGGQDRTVRLWAPATGAAVGQPLTADDAVRDVVFSPDGSTLASGGADAVIRMWDVQRGEARGAPFPGLRSWVNGLAFRPDGSTIASAADEGAELWAVDTGRPRGRPLSVDQGSALTFAFSRDGQMLAYTAESRIWLWNVREDLLVTAACRIANRDLTETERRTYLGSDRKIDDPCR